MTMKAHQVMLLKVGNGYNELRFKLWIFKYFLILLADLQLHLLFSFPRSLWSSSELPWSRLLLILGDEATIFLVRLAKLICYCMLAAALLNLISVSMFFPILLHTDLRVQLHQVCGWPGSLLFRKLICQRLQSHPFSLSLPFCSTLSTLPFTLFLLSATFSSILSFPLNSSPPFIYVHPPSTPVTPSPSLFTLSLIPTAPTLHLLHTSFLPHSLFSRHSFKVTLEL